MKKILLSNRETIKKFKDDEDCLGSIYLEIANGDINIDIEDIPMQTEAVYVTFSGRYMFFLWQNYEKLKHLKIYLISTLDGKFYFQDYNHHLQSLNLELFKHATSNKYKKIYIIGDTREAKLIHDFLNKYKYNVIQVSVINQQTIEKNDIALNCTHLKTSIQQSFGYLILSSEIRTLIEKLAIQNTPLTAKDFIDFLLTRYESTRYNPYAALAYHYQNNINQQKNRKKIAFYLPSCAYRNNLFTEEIYTTLEKKYNVYFLHGLECNDKFEKLENSYYAHSSIIGYFENIDLIIYPALTVVLPQRAKKLYMLHDIYDSPSGTAELPVKCKKTGKLKVSPFLKLLDYAFLPSVSVMPTGRKGNNLETDICYIPGGYFKLDENIKRFKTYEALGIDSIIYAPTVINDVLRKHHSQPDYGLKIVEALLENFHDYKIIFRPHPHSVRDQHTLDIVNTFQHNKRFIFDNNPSDYMKNYARSKLMVSDISGTAYTYAFTTLRPVVFFSVDETNVEVDMGGVSYFKDRSKIGSVVQSIDSMISIIQSHLNDYNNITDNVEKFRDEAIYNIGKSEEYFLKSLKYVLEDTKHPDWIYFK
ncbi:hypothetical protein JHD49_07245 [Sulfurimonas sp. SAG-AH-194-C21]|nr:hypothetical protein [Sulfurimonas sp. SAG-AH-194-C21]MDF1883726.1 hypothetical protein [Sulfurimonas sp. SAG-AH-194-C21]